MLVFLGKKIKIMEVQIIKLELIKLLLETDELPLLEKIKRLLAIPNGTKSPRDEIVGYHPGGAPVTKLELIQQLEESEEAIRRGEVISMEDLIKESENW